MSFLQGYPISIPYYFYWTHVLSGGYPSDWSEAPSWRSTRVSGRGYPSPRWREYPSPRSGSTSCQIWMGYPQPGQDGVHLSQVRMGYPPARSSGVPRQGQVRLGQVMPRAVCLLETYLLYFCFASLQSFQVFST